jgi:hypothetical protein
LDKTGGFDGVIRRELEKKPPPGEHREGAFFLVSPNGIFAFPLSVYAKFKKSQAYRKKITFYAPS